MKYWFFVWMMCQSTTVFAGETINKKAWLARYQNVLPAAVCKAGGFFRSCYQISGEECHALATAKTKSCSAQYTSLLPEQLRQPEDGNNWGTKIGICVGNMMDEALAEKKVINIKCSNTDAWK